MLRSPCAAFQAHPNDLELVDSYLRTWVETGVKTGAFIHDADVYAADPADLTRRFAPAVACDGERAWYFYTPLRHKSVHGKRKTRTVATGGGCWHNEAKSKPVIMFSADGKRHQVGHRQSFSFVKKDTGVRVRTGWLMVELRLLKDGGAAEQKPEAEESALGNRVLCKVYRSPRNPEPSGSGATAAAAAVAASPGHKAEADDDESSDATLDDDYNDDVDDDSSDASLAAASGPKNEVESSEATVAAPSRHSKANDEISGGDAAAPGRKEKAEVDEDSIETSAAAPPLKRKAALDDESSGAAGAPARKKKADSISSLGAPVSTTEMQCPQCGTHLVLTLKKAESKSETEIAKDEPTTPGASGAPPQRGETRGSSQKSVRFLQFL